MRLGKSLLPVLLALITPIAFLGCNGLSADHRGETSEFEGFIEYVTTYEAIDERFPVEEVIRQMGVRSTLYYKEGNIRIEHKDADTLWSIYRQSDNHEYTLLKGQDRLLYSDCGTPARELLGLEVEPSGTKILDREVSVMTARVAGEDTYIVSFAPSLSVNSKRFSYYEALPFWKNATGIYLKWETRRPYVVITKTATSVHEEPIPDTLFELPDLPRVSVSEYLESLNQAH